MQEGLKNLQVDEGDFSLELLAWTRGGVISGLGRVHNDSTLVVFGRRLDILREAHKLYLCRLMFSCSFHSRFYGSHDSML